MKRLIATSAAALAAFALTGCNDTDRPSGNYTWTDKLLVSATERPVGEGPIVLTQYEYDNVGAQKGEKQYIGGKLRYEDTDFKAEDVVLTRIRTVYNDDGSVKEKQKRHSTVKNILGVYMEVKFEAFLADADGNFSTTPFERYENEYDSNGNPSKYTLWENGVEVRYQWDYAFNTEAGEATFKRRDGGENGTTMPVYHRKTKGSDGKFDGGYKMYIGMSIDNGKLIEERSITSRDDLSDAYTISTWDNDGSEASKKTTSYTLEYEIKTFTY